MNREIKFRAWSNRVYYKPFTLLYGMGMSLSFSKETVFSQFTGFHDKEGKEIYEGDIFGNKMLRCHVEQEVGGAWIVVFADKKLGKMKLINDTVLKSSVVGNIFENPELLTP